MNNTTKLLPVFALALLSACGGSGDSTPVAPAITIPTVTIDAVGSTSTVNESGIYKLSIDGTGNTITVASGNLIDTLTLNGTGNMLTISDNVAIAGFTVGGSGHTVIVPVGSGITFTDTGVGNTLIEQ